jgi:hypothetical protein
VRDFLLDTQTIRYWHDSACSQHTAVTGNIAALRNAAEPSVVKPRLLVSVVTLGEIEFGHRVALAPNPAAQAAYMKFVREERPESLELFVRCGGRIRRVASEALQQIRTEGQSQEGRAARGTDRRCHGQVSRNSGE